jgi:hypothetical protein
MVRNLALGEHAELTGFQMWGPTVPPNSAVQRGTGLFPENNQGPVRAERCWILGADGMDLPRNGGRSQRAVSRRSPGTAWT